MSNKQRVDRIEKSAGGKSLRYFLAVSVEDGQTQEEAFRAAFAESGIRREYVGCAVFMGYEFGFKSEDYGGYEDLHDLIGYTEFWRKILRTTSTSWRSSIRKIIQKRREMKAEDRLEEFYRAMPLMRPSSD